MASRKMPGLVLLIHGRDMAAYLHCPGAACVEFTALGRICGRRNIAVQYDSVHLYVGIGVGHGGKQRLRVRMQGIIENAVFIAEFHHRPEVHYADAVGNVLDDRQIVRDKRMRTKYGL